MYWNPRTSRILGAVLAMALAGPALATGNSTAEQIRSIIHASAGADGPGCAIGILKRGKPFLTVVDGKADLSTHRQIDADTQFYSASIAKQFTALAVARLVVAGKISLNDDIRKYLPEMPRYQSTVTVYMLLHHTGGIRDMLTLGEFAGYPESSDVSRKEALRLVYAQTETVFPPGSQHRYSNSGYLLLSEIVARASGVSFADYMRAQIFQPLGMTRTWVLEGARTNEANAAHGYAVDGATLKIADTHPYYGGAGGMVLSLRDLAMYDRDIQVNHEVWMPAIAEIMLDPGKLADGSPAARRGVIYAAGLGLNGPWVQHSGAGEGFKNMVAWLPDGRLSVHVLCNSGAVDPAKIAGQVVDVLSSYPSLQPRMPSMAGRYSSLDLPVIYTLEPVDDAKLDVIITRRSAGLGRDRMIRLTRGADGSFAGEGFRIVADDDQNGFTLGDIRGRAGLIHFKRESREP